MKTLLRRIKDLLLGPKTPYGVLRARYMWFYRMGEKQGKKEAQAELPITYVQPWQPQITAPLHLPPGEWTRQWRATHGLRTMVLKPLEDDSWLNSKPPVKQAFDPYSTEEMPAVVKLLHERRHVG